MKRWTISMGLVLAMMVIVGCGSSSSDTSSPGGDETRPTNDSGSDISVAYMSPSAAQPGQQQVNFGLEKGAEELGWSESVLDSNLSPDKQVSNVEIAINKGISAIASWTLDSHTVTGAYEEAQKKGIPIIGMNSKGEGLSSTIWWELELCEPGGPQAVSAEMIAKLHPHAKTIMIGDHIAESTRALSSCFAKEAKRVGLDILTEAVTERGDAAHGQEVAEPLITKYPEVEAFWCFNDEVGEGASAALLGMGKTIATTENPEGVIVTGENGDKAAIEAVEEGRMSWTWDPDNVASGFAAIKAMKEALDGTAPKQIVVESNLVDGETVDDYVLPEEREYTLSTLPLKK